MCPRWRLLAVLGTALLLPLAACTGDDGGADGQAAQEVLADAKRVLDGTSGVRVSLTTDELPQGVTGVTSAEGVAVRPPAFEGTLQVSVTGLPAEVDVVSVGGVTYAKNSLLLPSWTQVDPADYGAPDPARLLAPDGGVSGLLTATSDVEEGESVRGGADNTEVLTEYSGVVPAEAVVDVIPSATGEFEVTYAITDAGELREAVITGEFYAGADSLTYTLTLEDYGTQQDIAAP